MAAELGSYKQAHTSSPPLTLGNNSRVVEGPAPLEEAGFQSPKLCVEVSPTISSRYLSTSHTSSGSFPPKAGDIPCPYCQSFGPGIGLPRPPATTDCYPNHIALHRPLMDLPAGGESLLEGGPTSPFWAEPGRVPWDKDPATRRSPASPNFRPGSRVGPQHLWMLGVDKQTNEEQTKMDKENRNGGDTVIMREDGKDNREKNNKYSKSLTVMVEVGGEKLTTMDSLKVIQKECGKIMGCRVRGAGRLEITMEAEEGKGKLIDGIKHKNTTIMAKDINICEMVVSFLNLPVYVEDKEIIDRLHEWGVRPVSAIRRRMWPGTEVADGTRYLKVKVQRGGEVPAILHKVQHIGRSGALSGHPRPAGESVSAVSKTGAHFSKSAPSLNVTDAADRGTTPESAPPERSDSWEEDTEQERRHLEERRRERGWMRREEEEEEGEAEERRRSRSTAAREKTEMRRRWSRRRHLLSREEEEKRRHLRSREEEEKRRSEIGSSLDSVLRVIDGGRERSDAGEPEEKDRGESGVTLGGERVLKEVERMVSDFLWDGKGVRIAREVMENEYEDGGLKLINLERKKKALRVKMMVMLELAVKHQVSSTYHLESQGALERFHQTLKSMLLESKFFFRNAFVHHSICYARHSLLL
ncbi:hypothetical protein L3Q82_023477 [Scortum barcoo]|uniref:Uncharacterized protein n=1 Tax=Scortum barcoo TaxID=214431 RepID=A0ACB8WSU1_9TELE|nr:hypothetical protein L3Q82_023477 [Scortum barcoo]